MKKNSKVKQVTGYKAIISRTEKDIAVLEAAKNQTYKKIEYSYESMNDFMNRSRSTFVSIIKTIEDKMVLEKHVIESLVNPYGEIGEITDSFKPFNYDNEILLALNTGQMNFEKLKYTVLKRQLEQSKESLFKYERIGELLIQFHSAKIKLIEVFPQLAKFNYGVN